MNGGCVPASFPLDFMNFMNFLTLGYPGEGPGSGFLLFFWIFFLGLVVVRSPVPSHGLLPRNAEDVKRAERRGSIMLDLGRPVQQLTKNNRERLLGLFSGWCTSRGIDFDGLLRDAPRTPEVVAKTYQSMAKRFFLQGGLTVTTARPSTPGKSHMSITLLAQQLCC